MGTLLGGGEKTWFDSVAVEVLRLAGVDNCVLYHFMAHIDGVSGIVDCLYGEPVQGSGAAKHYFPFKVLGYFEAPTRITDATEQGLVQVYDGRMYFSRKDLENAKVPPDAQGDRVIVGDIVQIFKAGRFWYFEFKNVERTGWVTDSQEYTHYVCDIIRTDDFVPERKLSGL